MMLKALIVDDEAPARSELRYLLENYPEIRVTGEAASAEEAFELLKDVNYDLIFLDIQMPGLSGLEFAEQLKKYSRQPDIIFITAYDEHAVKAFELQAIDYILKPFDKDRLEKAIENAQERIQKNKPIRQFARVISKIPLKKEGKTILLPISDIYYIDTSSDITRIHTFNQSYICHLSLKDIEARLADLSFFRSHKSFIVNLNKVDEIIPLYGGNYLLRLRDQNKSEVPVSRRRARDLKEIIGM